jgi:hypothetical protein
MGATPSTPLKGVALDVLSKPKLIASAIAFFVSVIIIVIIGAAGPVAAATRT